MKNRTKKGQTCHNESVRRRAAALKAHGYKVQADIPDYPQPPIMNHSRADIVATKNKKIKIIEVETPNSVKKDKLQHKNLERYAKSHKNTTFDMKVCDVR